MAKSEPKLPRLEVTKREAVISDDQVYRYQLTREWVPRKHPGDAPHRAGTVLWIMLNPSTADHVRDDPTAKKCMQFTAMAGFSRLSIVNLYAFRATDPDELHADLRKPVAPGAVRGATSFDCPTVGPRNDLWLETEAADARMIVCAWGSHGAHRNVRPRVQAVLLPLLDLYQVHALGVTKERQPGHPLTLGYACTPQVWAPDKALFR